MMFFLCLTFYLLSVSTAVSTPTKNVALLGVDREQWTSDVVPADRKNYDSVLEQVLSLLEPVCLQEQQFCVLFFQVSKPFDIS